MKYTIQLLRSVKHATQLLKCLSADHLKYTPSLTKFKKIQMPKKIVNSLSDKCLGRPTFIVMYYSYLKYVEE